MSVPDLKVLVAGNSQASVLRAAARMIENPATQPWPHFYVVPGGLGPHLAVAQDGVLEVTAISPKAPPYFHPVDVEHARLLDYDAIVVSALGFVDGGFAFHNSIIAQGLVAEFQPRDSAPPWHLISQATQREVVRSGFERQDGFRFLRGLREAFDGPVLVQPFPYLSDVMPER